MPSWNDLSVGKKISINIAISLILLVLLTGMTMNRINGIKTSAEETRDISSRYAILAKEIQIHVIQTQQWLTDISVTRAADGLDDGFDEALAHKKALNEKLEEFNVLYSKQQDQEMLSFIEELKRSYNDFYDMGLQMADKYINEGTEAGNEFMLKFDPFAAKITEEVHQLVISQTQNLDTSMGQITDNANQLFSMFLTSVIILLIVNIVVGTTISKSITAPLEKLVKTANDISSGNLTRKTNILSKNEVGSLAASIDIMAHNMRKMVGKIRDGSDELAVSSRELASASLQMASGAEEMSNQSTEVASAASQINESMNQIAKTAEKLTAKFQETASSAEIMSGNVNSVSAAVEQMSVSIDDVAENTNQAAQLAEEAHRHSKLANTNMDELNKSAADIGGIIHIITKITEQTKLLALNATIEAARAGNAGEGFAVVANEVKELAKQTTDATQTIVQRIKAIQEQTNVVVGNLTDIEQFNQQVNEITSTISAAVQEQSFTTNDISETIADTSNKTNSIFETVQSLSVEIHQNILQNVVQATSATNEVANNINNVSAASNQVSQSVNFVSKTSDGVKNEANLLLEQVQQFQIS